MVREEFATGLCIEPSRWRAAGGRLNALYLQKAPLLQKLTEIEKSVGGWEYGKIMPAEWNTLSAELDAISNQHQVLLNKYHQFFVKRSSKLRVPKSNFGDGLLSGHEL
jgi:hypothetical protein